MVFGVTRLRKILRVFPPLRKDSGRSVPSITVSITGGFCVLQIDAGIPG